MPVIKLKATKMSDASVSFISLVERGANRIPFKIMKKEKDMSSKSSRYGFDLANLFSAKKSEVVEDDLVSPAVVIGIATMKGESLGSARAKLEELGFSINNEVEMEDGSVVFKQEAESSINIDTDEDVELIRVSDSVVLVTKGYRPYSMDVTVGGESFANLCKARGFYPGISSVVDLLGEAIRAATGTSDSPAIASAAVSKIFDEAKAYVAGMVAALPASAFTVEDLSSDVIPTYKSEESPGSVEGGSPEVDSVETKKAKVEDGIKKAEEAADVCKVCSGKKSKATISVKEDIDACVCGADLTESEIDAGVLKAALSDEEKMYAAKLKGADKFAFFRMSSSDRAKAMGSKETVKEEAATEAKVVAEGVGEAIGAVTEEESAVEVVPEAEAPTEVEAVAVVKSLTAEEVSSIVADQVGSVVSALTKKMDELVSGIATKVEKSLSEVEGKVTQVEALAQSTNDSLSGIVVGASPSADPEGVVKIDRVVKGDIDTAFQPNARTRRRG